MLSRVTALDNPQTWSGPFADQAHGTFSAWTRALAHSTAVMRADVYAGFDTDRVAAPQRAVSDAAVEADHRSRAVARIVDEAVRLLGSPGETAGHRLDDRSSGTDGDRAGLSALASAGAGLAAEIGRRLAHLKSCEELARRGFAVDVDTVFDDRPPADAVKVRSALETLRRELSADPGLLGNRDELIRINQAIAGLNDAEAEAFVRALSVDDLRRWNGALSQQGARVTVVRIHDMPNRGHNASTSPPPPPVERPMKFTSWPAAGTIGRSRWIAAGVAMIPPTEVDVRGGDRTVTLLFLWLDRSAAAKINVIEELPNRPIPWRAFTLRQGESGAALGVRITVVRIHDMPNEDHNAVDVTAAPAG